MKIPMQLDLAGALLLLMCSGGLIAGGIARPGFAADGDRPTFAEDVQPLLRRHCYRCHGSKNQEADLQLNARQSARVAPIIVPHQADASLLIQRLVDEQYGERMPLDGQPLSADEIATLRQWIDQGASWPAESSEDLHWAYQRIQRPDVPADQAATQPIDAFIGRTLQQRGPSPTEPTDRARLLRRVSLVLTGIPPTPEETDVFLQDASPHAFERIVDRLLSSPRFGEHWAVPWLDLARYADSNGFQADQLRDNWAYRDWVVRALNSDMPFDQFVIDQIAGDLKPEADVDSRIASGFHRMTTCNVEAGVHPEANRVNQIIDRVNTTATAFLGTTLECAQCHDHKYDPFTQRDYYRLFAYFNNTPLEVKQTSGVTWDFYGPTMDLPWSDERHEQRAELQRQRDALHRQRSELREIADQAFAQWLSELAAAEQPSQTWQTVVPERFESSGEEHAVIREDGAVLLSGPVPDTALYQITIVPPSSRLTALRLEVLTDEAVAGHGPGRGDPVRTNIVLNEFRCELIEDGRASELKLTAAAADFSQANWNVEGAIDGDGKTGWAIAPQFGKPHWARFLFAQPLALDATSQQLKITLVQNFGQGRVIAKPRLSVSTADPRTLDIPPQRLARIRQGKLSEAEREELRVDYQQHDPRWVALEAQIKRLDESLEALQPETTLVMSEMEQPRETFVMLRGDYENLGEAVDPGLPEALPGSGMASGQGDRMELARWLTSPENPLLARVTVNRWWAGVFGRGLVSTPEDFGTQSEAPSHPQLLDWLASELIDSGWSMKHVLKRMVMCETFQQSAALTAHSLAADPDNRWLSRGPRVRLPAESIRDNALAISGLLSENMGGPPIMPYQPDNVWRSIGRNQPKWSAAEDADRFRRGLYVVWKRAAPYPSFVSFDAPDRGGCTVQRARTNTPLQALVLLNDPAYTEMALAFADRILHECPAEDDASRIAFAIRLALTRQASAQEIDVLKRLLGAERRELAEHPELIAQRTRRPFADLQWHSPADAELAAWFAIANTLLNLDETIHP